LQFYKDGKYDLDYKNPASKPEDYLTAAQLKEVYDKFCADFPSLRLLGLYNFLI
jgi:enolase